MTSDGKDIAKQCGYSSSFDLLRDNIDTDELLDLLEQYISEDDSGMVGDMVKEIAIDKLEWVDHEEARADHEDAEDRR